MKSAFAVVATITLIWAGNARAAGMPPMASELGCTTCHAIDHKILGPAWMDVSKKYKGQATYKYSSHGADAADARELPLVDGLVMKVSKGGSGNWGPQPMPANNPTGSKKDKIQSLVEFILALAK